jgi:hypothetical protein
MVVVTIMVAAAGRAVAGIRLPRMAAVDMVARAAVDIRPMAAGKAVAITAVVRAAAGTVAVAARTTAAAVTSIRNCHHAALRKQRGIFI